jgi:thiol-disulfide isomerase/thioredoxin
MDKTIKSVAIAGVVVLVGILILLAFPALTSPAKPAISTTPIPGTVTVFYFYGEECPHCHEIMPFIDNLSVKYPEVDFRKLETWHNPSNDKLAALLNAQIGVKETGVPEAIVGNTALFGSKDIPEKLENLILEQKKKLNS